MTSTISVSNKSTSVTVISTPPPLREGTAYRMIALIIYHFYAGTRIPAFASKIFTIVSGGVLHETIEKADSDYSLHAAVLGCAGNLDSYMRIY